MTERRKADVVLVQMPNCFLTPSLALSILKRGLTDAGISAYVEYATHYFVRYIGYDRYDYADRTLGLISARGWEFLFAPFAGFRPAVSDEELYEAVYQEFTSRKKDSDVLKYKRLIQSLRESTAELRKMIPAFLEEEAERILSFEPKIVGFTVMTQQRNATFAMARVLKEKRPDLITIMGGGVCVGEAAVQFLRHAPGLDYVFTGEGDRGLALACKSLIETGEVPQETFPYMLRRGAKPHYLLFSDLDDIPVPDFRDYNEIVEGDDFTDKYYMQVPMEASRGCWWSMKERCRFCGLHYCAESACYRQKSPEKFWSDIEQVNCESGFTVFMLADCIISRRLVDSLPDKCPPGREKYTIFAECRTDLTEDDLRRMAENRILFLQPGVESLQDDLLKQMNKGRTAMQHVLFLVRCLKCGVKPIWNILIGIPGEEDTWYEEMFCLMDKIHHLYPPTNAWPMLLSRGSEFQVNAEKYGVDYGVRFSEYAAGPADQEFLEATADFYAFRAKSIGPDTLKKVFAEYHSWRDDFSKGASLTGSIYPDRIEIDDRRSPDRPAKLTLTGCERDVLIAAKDIAGIASLPALLGVDADMTDRAVNSLDSKRLIYRKGYKILCIVCLTEGAYNDAP